jgi:hypothetical protein
MSTSQTAPAVQVTPVKQINNKTAGVNPRDAVLTGKPVFMQRIYGVIQGVKNFEDRKSGDVKTVFIGEFVAVGATGNTFTAENMFAFKQLEEKLVGVFKSGEGKEVEFSYDIQAIPDEKSATGYVYTARSVLPTATSERLAGLAKSLAEHPMPSMDAPVAEAPKPEAAKAAAKK